MKMAMMLCLPPYHPDLNPIEMVWAAIKGYVSSKNVRWNVPRVIELVNEKVNVMGPCEWKKLCDKIKSIEEAYIKSDHVIDEMTEEFIIHVGDFDSSDDENDSSTDSENETLAPSSSLGPSTSGPIPLANYVEGVTPMSDSD